MAESLIRAGMRLRYAVALTLTLAMAVSVSVSIAGAEELVDPTRPPASLGEVRDDAAAAVSGPVLQTILISTGRRIAVISGHEVRVGEKVGDATVVNIADDEVTLRSGKSMQRLKLFPGIEKRLAVEASRSNATHPKSIVGGKKGKP